MHEAEESSTEKLPTSVAACHEVIKQQASEHEKLAKEMEKLRKLLHRLVNGNQSEKRILNNPGQGLLPFESEEEFQAAKEEAEAEAKQIVDQYTVNQHERKKKRRNESLPADLPRVEVPVEVDDTITHCPAHGERSLIGEDVQETLGRQGIGPVKYQIRLSAQYPTAVTLLRLKRRMNSTPHCISSWKRSTRD